MESDDFDLKMSPQRSRSKHRTFNVKESWRRISHKNLLSHGLLRRTQLDKTNVFHLLMTLILTLTFNGAEGQFTCRQPGYNDIVPWRTEASSINVTWRLDQVCSSTIQCYGPTAQTVDQLMAPQLCPVQLQAGDSLLLNPPPSGSPYATTVVNVTEAAFYSCPNGSFPPDQILRNRDPAQALQIPARFLTPGVVYLAQHPDGAFSNCNFGLRLTVLVKSRACGGGEKEGLGGTQGGQSGLEVPGGAQLCSGRGVCGSRFLEERYRCYCYENYHGTLCDEFDACASDPCKNGGNCIDGVEGLLGSTFQCICAEGFTGPACTEVLGQCTRGICGNGSCRAVSQIAFKCECFTGYSGTYCDQFADMCTPNPCLNQATCLTQFQSYSCQCQPGFVGGDCEVNVDECASSPCAAAATCVDDVNGFYCQCPPGFDSDLCFEPINFCASAPCENDAQCLPVINGFFCNCTLGFHGDRCQTVISRCTQVPGVCQHGGHCLQSPDGPVQCQCSPGWTGATCDKLDNLCRFNPCPNFTVCVDKSSLARPGAYVCSCPPGFSGDRCESEIVECSSNPCLNQGICVDRLDSYRCICPQGYTGANCEINIDMCEGRGALLCQNNATCVDGDAGFEYSCICLPGFTSADCSVDIDECASTPCLYNGTCTDRVNGYTCACPDGFSGRDCQTYFNYCTLRYCRNGARCTPALGSYTCTCSPGWAGRNCTRDVDECASDPCLNGATCENLANRFRCLCAGDYVGPRCETSFDNCDPDSCKNGATCIDLVDDFRCACLPGFVGRDCGTEVVECLSAPCQNGGLCRDLINGYQCFCDAALWGGTNCEVPLNNCSSAPCQNGARCRPLTAPPHFSCACAPRYTGRLCETLVELCTSSRCLNGATCRENVSALTYTCECAIGFTGDHCEEDRDFCRGHNCRNGATCEDGATGYTCLCPPGFTGQFCEINVDNCASNPCKNEAVCEDRVNGYQCFCANGFTGTDCEEDVDECESSPCYNQALCLDSVNRFVCVCATGFEGPRCETNIDDCVGHRCQNNAACLDGINEYTCRCREGYIGLNCEFDINECLFSPCDSTGSILCSNLVANYSCLCKAGYTGRNCEMEIDECVSDPCRNGATCSNLIDKYQCSCVPGTTGTNCETTIDHCASNPCGTGTCEGSVTDYRCLCPSDGRDYDPNCQPLLPCRSNPCQNQATCINRANGGYRCLCLPGYTGGDCSEANYCQVNNVTCSNGGLCVNVVRNFTCVCTAGYSGRFCDVNTDECQSNICKNGATCEDGLNRYTCRCRAGYVGRYCENVATSCVEEPCFNGATCVPVANFAARTLFTCICPDAYEGAYCEREADECAPSPCRNGGTCTQDGGAFTCTCKPGYTGRTCADEIDECVGNGCQNGAACLDKVNGYICQCPPGFIGNLCESEVNECKSSPCQNGGQCVDEKNGYQCFCRNGFTGVHCEVDYDECLSDPCQNEATCINYVATFECQCPLGVTGALCETNIDECSSSPCRNAATCLDLYNGYNCSCVPGYTGAQCETDVDECASSPCDNGGTCRDREGMYVCDCVQPYRGVSCNLLPCEPNPCESGGTCHNDLSRLPDGFRCDCIEGLTGTRCQSNVDDCVMRNGVMPCSGRGLCLDDINKYTCLCQPGWKGQDCEVPIDECTNNDCRNNATCINLWTGYRCACRKGFEGQFCERETDECRPDPCTNSATCVDLPNDYQCLCREGWTGKRCETEVNECRVGSVNPCLNGGTCLDGVANFTCQCPAFYTGRLCERRYDPCDNDHYSCQQEAVCRTQPDGTYLCLCPTGVNCEIDVDECSSSPCANGARCEDQRAAFRCYCTLGFTGVRCEVNIDDCLYCQNGATCQDLVNGYTCTCAQGFRGKNCSNDIDECENTSLCKNGATCANTYGSYRCICKPGYIGAHCEVDVDECASSPCQNGARCVQGFAKFTCFCPLGFTGELCEINIDDCAPEPCVNGKCRDLVNSYTCECDAGWTGDDCEVNIDECLSAPCQHGGSCIDGVNSFSCRCPAGYTGPHCEIDIEVCEVNDVSQCRNGGTCNDGPGAAFNCICKPGYTGRFCEVDIDECASSPCKKGGTCQDQVNGYSCKCPQGFTSDDCSVDIDECASSPCMNLGICKENPAGEGYECLCRSGLGGVHCEINYDDCLSTSCLNGGTCVDALNAYTCICPEHVTGLRCETLLLTPSTAFPVTSSTDDIQSSTGGVLSSDFPLAPSSVLSGGVQLTSSTVAENSVPYVTRISPSGSSVWELLHTTSSVAMETRTPFSVSMTTKAAPESSGFVITSTFVESSFQLDVSPESVFSLVSTPVLPTSTADYSTIASETELFDSEISVRASASFSLESVLPKQSVNSFVESSPTELETRLTLDTGTPIPTVAIPSGITGSSTSTVFEATTPDLSSLYYVTSLPQRVINDSPTAISSESFDMTLTQMYSDFPDSTSQSESTSGDLSSHVMPSDDAGAGPISELDSSSVFEILESRSVIYIDSTKTIEPTSIVSTFDQMSTLLPSESSLFTQETESNLNIEEHPITTEEPNLMPSVPVTAIPSPIISSQSTLTDASFYETLTVISTESATFLPSQGLSRSTSIDGASADQSTLHVENSIDSSIVTGSSLVLNRLESTSLGGNPSIELSIEASLGPISMASRSETLFETSTESPEVSSVKTTTTIVEAMSSVSNVLMSSFSPSEAYSEMYVTPSAAMPSEIMNSAVYTTDFKESASETAVPEPSTSLRYEIDPEETESKLATELMSNINISVSSRDQLSTIAVTDSLVDLLDGESMSDIQSQASIMLSSNFLEATQSFMLNSEMETTFLGGSTDMIYSGLPSILHASSLYLHPSSRGTIAMPAPTTIITDSAFASLDVSSHSAIDVASGTSEYEISTQPIHSVSTSPYHSSLPDTSLSDTNVLSSEPSTVMPSIVMSDLITELPALDSSMMMTTESLEFVHSSESLDNSEEFTHIEQTSVSQFSSQSIRVSSISLDSSSDVTPSGVVSSGNFETLVDDTDSDRFSELDTSMFDELSTSHVKATEDIITSSMMPVMSKSSNSKDGSILGGEPSVSPAVIDSMPLTDSDLVEPTIQIESSSLGASTTDILVENMITDVFVSSSVLPDITGNSRSVSALLTSQVGEHPSPSVTSSSLVYTGDVEIYLSSTVSSATESLDLRSESVSDVPQHSTLSLPVQGSSSMISSIIAPTPSSTTVTFLVTDSVSHELVNTESVSDPAQTTRSSAFPPDVSSSVSVSSVLLAETSMTVRPSSTILAESESLVFPSDSMQISSSLQLPSTREEAFTTTVLTSPASQMTSISAVSSGLGTIDLPVTPTASDLETVSVKSSITDESHFSSMISATMTTEPTMVQSSFSMSTEPVMVQSSFSMTTEPVMVQSLSSVTTESVMVQSSSSMATESFMVQSSFSMTTESVMVQSSFSMSTEPVMVQSSFSMSTEPVMVQSSSSMSTEPVMVQSSFSMTTESVMVQSTSSLSTDPVFIQSSSPFSQEVPSLAETLSPPSITPSIEASPTMLSPVATTPMESKDTTSTILEGPPESSLIDSTIQDTIITPTSDTAFAVESTVFIQPTSVSAGLSSSLSLDTVSSAVSGLSESLSTMSESPLPMTSIPSISPGASSITEPEMSVTDVTPSGDASMTQTVTESVEPSLLPSTPSPTPGSTSSPSISPSPAVTTGPSSSITATTTETPVTTAEPTSCDDVAEPCFNNGICYDVTLPNNENSFFCRCPPKYNGKRCTIPRVFDPMKFTGASLLTFDPIPLRSENRIWLSLRTYQRDGVLFYSAREYTVSDSTHYILLVIRDGFLMYEFSCVFRSFKLESNVKVDTGELFNVSISQSEDCKARLDVAWAGNSVSVEAGAPFVFPSLYLRELSTFYVGGVPDNVSYVPPPAPNFAGCLGVVHVNGDQYGFFQARHEVNVAECGVTIPTVSPPSVSTPPPLPVCDDVTCQNGGTCRDVVIPSGQSRYLCDCPLHFTGKHCEQEIGISFPAFIGQSYLKHPDLDLSERPSNDLYLTFKTRSRNGTLLYAESDAGEFVHLFIEDGFAKYQASCGPSNVLFVDTRVTVNNNNLTSVNIRQTEKNNGDCTVTVTVNSDIQTTVTLSLAPPQQGRLYDLGPLYLGGLPPEVSPLPRASPFINFVGCIRHLQINGEERLVFQDAIAGRNVIECDVPPCQYTPCYNNATCLPSVDGYTCECLPSYSGALCERTACDRNPCQHGGTCLHEPHVGTYTCLCPYGRHGINCEKALTITRPQYFGTRLGYISFAAYPRLLGLDYTFDFRFRFTVSRDHVDHTGLMLFAGQGAANPKYGADFFAIGIQEGYIHFQFNLGSGLLHVRSRLPVNASRPSHRVAFGRDRRAGYLSVDGQDNVTGTSGGTLQGLNIFSPLYVGGYDNYDVTPPGDVIFRDGFKGCLFDLEVRTGTNGHWRAPGHVITGRNVGQCQLSECDVTACQHGGTCVDLGATHRCDCVEGWRGPTCSDVITPCDGNHECAGGATCLPLATGGYTCHCPLGKAGTQCDQAIIITDARFVGESSYMEFAHKGSLRFAIDIRLQFKPEVTTGLILYVAEHLSVRSGDFLSIVIQDGRAQLRYRVGTGPAVVVSSRNAVSLTSGAWHVINAGRNTTHGYVTLDGQTTVLKVSSEMVGLDVTTPIFVGGVPDLGTLAPSAVENEPSAFEGCVRELVVNNRVYHLSEKGAARGVNVEDCDGTACGYQVCQHGGTCFPRATSGFVCACTPDYFGFRCETSVLCRDNLCAGGATCVPEVSNATYRCICPLGRRGVNCEEEFSFVAARFAGDGFILVHDTAYNSSDVTKTYMSFNFSTTAYNGLIMWNGDAYSDKDDYLGVGIHKGRARVVISLGWWTREDVITDDLVNNGEWHSLIIQRSSRQLRVYVDGKPYDVSLAGTFGGLNTGGAYYFGGFEFGKSTWDETCSHFDSGFVGCLRDVYLHADSQPLHLLNKASSGANVYSCENR